MKTELVFVGKTSDKRFEAAIDDYVKRVEHYMPVKLTVIPALKNTKNQREEQQKVAQGDRNLKQLQQR
uniref:23S rRNA (pseudouridine(1915)-N(3))-methyltransferase RlmH n=1 Tax=Prevotella sp. TaxID=59823 RepID=UPI004024A9F5